MSQRSPHTLPRSNGPRSWRTATARANSAFHRNFSHLSSASLTASFFKYESPATNLRERLSQRSFSLCTCLKCGSTALFNAIYAALTGRPFPKKTGPPWAQDYLQWGEKGVSVSSSPGDVHFHVYRDPIDRLISAFASKLRCCDDGRPCYADGSSNDFAKWLLWGNGNHSGAACLSFADFVRNLRLAHQRGKQRLLNRHWLPQHLGCPNVFSVPSFRGTVAEVAPALRALHGLRLPRQPIEVVAAHTVSHASADEYWERQAGEMRALCEVTQHEYAALGLLPPRRCKQAARRGRHSSSEHRS